MCVSRIYHFIQTCSVPLNSRSVQKKKKEKKKKCEGSFKIGSQNTIQITSINCCLNCDTGKNIMYIYGIDRTLNLELTLFPVRKNYYYIKEHPFLLLYNQCSIQ